MKQEKVEKLKRGRIKRKKCRKENKMVKKKGEYEGIKKKLEKILGEGWQEELKDAEKVIEKMGEEKKGANAKAKEMREIQKMIKENPEWEIPEKEWEKYWEEARKQGKEDYKERKKKEVDMEEVTEWEEIKAIRKKLKKEAEKGGKEEYLDWLLIALYTKINPTQANYDAMRIIDSYDKNKSKKYNYLVFSKEEKTRFIMKKGETEIEVEIPKDLKKIIKGWLEKYNTEKKYLLAVERKKAEKNIKKGKKKKMGELKVMSENDIGKRIKQIFIKKMGYSMGIREICKSYNAKEN